MASRRFFRARVVLSLPAVVAAALLPAAPALAHAASTGSVVVSTHGTDSATCGAPSAPCQTITRGVMNAAAGGKVLVRAGTYHEQVVVTKPLVLRGSGASIDATGLSSGSGATLNAAAVLVLDTAGGTKISGLSIHGAFGEGILVMGAPHVLVAGNRVFNNDLGTPTTTTYLECQTQGEIPGDCGEGIHLMSSMGSAVVHNVITGNSGGVLVTDELGPAAHNLIFGNFIARNLSDCGVTLPSHNPAALSATGQRQPTMGGVYGNVVAHNIVLNNGTKGLGAGVLMAAAGPGMASYGNLVLGNVISGNGLAGVTIHSHAPNQDVSDNVIAGNRIGRNNLVGDPDANVKVTTGILVFSAVVPVRVTIADNVIRHNEIRVFVSPNVTVLHHVARSHHAARTS